MNHVIKKLIKGICKNTSAYFLLLILSHLCSATASAQPQGAAGNDSIVQQYNLTAAKLLNEAKYDESINLLNQALKMQDNAVSHYYLGHIYLVEKNWGESIKNSETAIRINPGLGGVYQDLFFAYEQSGRWKDAQGLIDKVKQNNPNLNIEADVTNIESSIDSQGRSQIVIIILFSILAGIFFRPIYLASKNQTDYFSRTGDARLTELLLVSASVSCILWLVFFALSHWIWSLNPHYSASDFTPIVRIFIFEQDGAESFVMYFMMFANLFTTLLLTPLLLKTRLNKNQYLGVFTILLLIAGFYFFSIGFYPPLQAVDSKAIFVPIVLAILGGGLYYIYQKNSLIAKIAAICIMAFAGLIAIGPPSLPDLQFVLDPALRLMHGFKVSEIYFQYDLFLSFLTIAWIKMNMSIELLPYVGQVSFFLFYIAIFFFSDKFFKSKGLSVMFILALIIMRFYAIYGDVPTILQVSPLRLDLWLLLLLVANKKGVNHWLLGTVLGLLVLFHRNLGLLYLGAYVELMFVLFLLDNVAMISEKSWSVKACSALFMKHLKSNLINIIIIIGSIGLCFLLFHEFFSKSAMIYRKLGIGMLPIAKISFYWYVPVLLGTLISMIFYYRNKLGEKYTSVALFVIFLVIGNSMYFFGRSHENNILNITGTLILSLFVLFDILIFLAPKTTETPKMPPAPAPVTKNKKGQPAQAPVARPAKASMLSGQNIYLFLPVLFLLFIGFFYSQRISDKLKIQTDNLASSTFAYPFPNYPKDMDAVKKLTQNSQNVYFLDLYYDAFYYYNGNYTPLGYFSPASSWVFKKDIIGFMQDLLDKHYYVVYVGEFAQYYKEYLPYLKYNHSSQLNGWIALSKDDVALQLPETVPSQYHIGIKDTLGNSGIEYSGFMLKDSFTIEAIVKPVGPQVPNATILSNLIRGNGIKGLTLQANNNFPDKYVFGFSNGAANIPNVVFDLENNKWHYITVVVNKEMLKVFDNGKMVASVATGGQPDVNSDAPLMIGNNGNHDSRFRGYIREVNISNGNLDEATIVKNADKVASGLK